MKKFKRFAALALCAVTALSMCACSGAKKDEKKFVVGICQLVEHEALDAATNGFKEKLTEKLEAEGYTVEFKEQSAQGDSATCTTIINGYVSSGVDLILAKGGQAIITADHGNSDEVTTLEGTPMTAHTTNPVPVIITQAGIEVRDGGKLADLAPTMLDLLGVSQPAEMTGETLIKK